MSTHREPAVRNTLILILVLNAVVAAVKVVVGLRTNALSVLGASLESTLDVLNNIVGIALVRVASQEPDEDHPYGHQKFETLGALAIVGFLSISCFELLREGVRHLLVSEHPAFPSLTELSLIAATMFVNVGVVWYERRRARQLNSDFLLADAAHTRSDIYVTAAAFASLVLARGGYGAVDALLAIGVALLIAWNGYQIVRHTVPVLVDERGVDAGVLRRVVGAIPDVVDVRTVRSRSIASDVLFAEVTIGVNGATTVEEAHLIADKVEEKIAKELGVAEVLVHVEPA
ncbi:MAG TPA: cation diffusion facilitator family transporter [Gemmatimonadaceae bacterium]|nr:cation diffusion facilitator family transporter [Gemmatimonadaceae bacterium]